MNRLSLPRPTDAGSVRVARVVAASLLWACAATGCVRNTLVIESTPPGADVFVNHDIKPAGQTPVEIPLEHFGTYQFRLVKQGHEELTVLETIRPKTYERMPADLIAEHLIPVDLERRRTFHYNLVPDTVSATTARLNEPDEARINRLRDALQSHDTATTRDALMELTSFDAPSLLEDIERRLLDPQPEIRAAAIHAYRVTAKQRGVKRLIAMLQDSEPDVRAQAASALASLQDPEAVAYLVLSINDDAPMVRSSIVEALGSLRAKEAAADIIARLRDGNAGVRRSAADALGKLGDPSAVRPLIRALRDKNLIVRRRAVEALQRLGDPHAVSALLRRLADRDEVVRDTAAEAILNICATENAPVFVRGLNSRHVKIRHISAKALGQLNQPSALHAVEARHDRESNPTVRQELEHTAQKLRALNS